MNDGMESGLKFVMSCFCAALFMVVTMISLSKYTSPEEDGYSDCQQASEYIQKSVDFTITVKATRQGLQVVELYSIR